MKLTIGSGGVPVGTYTMQFAGYEEVPPDDVRGYGQGLRWRFAITEGKYKGQIASRITTLNPRLKNACGKFLTVIMGKPLTAGEDVELDDYIGTSLYGTIGETESGATRVESIMRPPLG